MKEENRKKRTLRIVRRSNKKYMRNSTQLEQDNDAMGENEAYMDNAIKGLVNLTDRELADSFMVDVREAKKEASSFVNEAIEFIDNATRTPWYNGSDEAKEFVVGFKGLCGSLQGNINSNNEPVKRDEESDEDYLFRVMDFSGETVDIQGKIDIIYDLMNTLQAKINNK